jgi:hypothetical protein
MARADLFRRIVAHDPNGAIYFLPWRTSFKTALDYGLVGLRQWRLCYELPAAVVTADPDVCARANRAVIEDAADQIERRRPPVLVGLSMGTVPATLLAGRYRAPLWSFASADRGDLMIWQSPRRDRCAARPKRPASRSVISPALCVASTRSNGSIGSIRPAGSRSAASIATFPGPAGGRW